MKYKPQKWTYNEVMSFISKYERNNARKVKLDENMEKIIYYSKLKKVPDKEIYNLIKELGYQNSLGFLKKYIHKEIFSNQEKVEKFNKELKKEGYL